MYIYHDDITKKGNTISINEILIHNINQIIKYKTSFKKKIILYEMFI